MKIPLIKCSMRWYLLPEKIIPEVVAKWWFSSWIILSSLIGWNSTLEKSFLFSITYARARVCMWIECVCVYRGYSFPIAAVTNDTTLVA